MPNSKLIRTAALAALILAAAPPPPGRGTSGRRPRQRRSFRSRPATPSSRFIPLGVGKSVAIDLPRDIKDVLVADPKVANAVIRSSRRVYMIGVAVGQTNIFFFDAQGHQIAGFDIAVTRDLNGLRAAFRRVLPDAHIQVEGMGEGADPVRHRAEP